jgi:alpha/beta superfamily hydrolase
LVNILNNLPKEPGSHPFIWQNPNELIIECHIENPKTTPKGLAVIAHPHPLQEGTMNNKVVTTLARAYKSCGISALRYNCRGVGQSTGSFDNGIGESEDLISLSKWAYEQICQNHNLKDSPFFLGGFSFGAFLALKTASKLPCRHLITVAPAVTRFPCKQLGDPTAPWLLIQGEADEVIAPEAVYSWAKEQQWSAELQITSFPETGHFFHGQLPKLKATVESFITNTI